MGTKLSVLPYFDEGRRREKEEKEGFQFFLISTRALQ